MNSARFIFVAAAAAALQLSSILRAAVQPIEAVSTADPSLPLSASAGGDSLDSTVSPDGSFVVFMSNAGNLVSNQTVASVLNIFLRNRTNGLTTLISVDAAGAGGANSNAVLSSCTPDGRYVAFASSANDLVPDDTNRVSDVFVRDARAGKTILVSANPAGAVGNGASSGAVLTADGRYVAFTSAASDLVADDTNGIPDVFVRDLQTGATRLVSVGARDLFGGWCSSSPVLSSNGQFVAFTSTASNLVAGVTGRTGEVYVRDLSARTTVWASSNILAAFADAFGATQLLRPTSYGPMLSDDGRWLTFKTSAGYATDTATNSDGACLIFRLDLQTSGTAVVCTNAEPGATGVPDTFGPVMTPDGRFIAFTSADSPAVPRNVFVWDAQSGVSTPISVNLDGVISTNGMSDTPTLSPDGRYVTFLSDAPDLVTNAVNGEFQAYIRDREAGTTRLVSADADAVGAGDAEVAIPTLSDDGRVVVFDSISDVFASHDRNQANDVFVRDLESDATELVSAAAAGLDRFTSVSFSSLNAGALSADGRWLVFTSLQNDLVAGHTNGYWDVYVRDLEAGTNVLVSVAADGRAANGSSSSPAISADGRYVAFVSSATNLVANDANRADDVFVRDLQAGTTVLVSRNVDGTGSGNGRSLGPSLSADGRRVAFQSAASDLTPFDSNELDGSADDVFVRDLDLGSTTLASTRIPGAPGSTAFTQPTLSPDGRFVAFRATAGTNRFRVKDLLNGTMTDLGGTNVVASAFSGDSRRLVVAFGTGPMFSRPGLMFLDLLPQTGHTVLPDTRGMTLASFRAALAVDDDGRYTAFSCNLALTEQDTNVTYDVFLYDATADNLTLVSLNQQGAWSGNGASLAPTLSADGRFLAFHSWASDLVADDLDTEKGIFLYDRLAGTTTLVSRGAPGLGPIDGRSSDPLLSAGGNRLVFRALATDLVAGDFNQTQDVFAAALVPDAVVVDPHPIFQVQAAVQSDGRTDLSWNAAPGRSYRVQFKDDLAAPTWSELGGIVAILGPRAHLTDATSTATSQRFYRVVLVD